MVSEYDRYVGGAGLEMLSMGHLAGPCVPHLYADEVGLNGTENW